MWNPQTNPVDHTSVFSLQQYQSHTDLDPYLQQIGHQPCPPEVQEEEHQWRMNRVLPNHFMVINGEYVEPVQSHIDSGIPDWTEWCNCKRKCGRKWSFQWLSFLKKHFTTQTRTDQGICIILWAGTLGRKTYRKKRKEYFYNLPDYNKKKHPVCFDFFCKVLGIGKHRVIRYLRKTHIYERAMKENRGKYSRQLPWKNKVDFAAIDLWIQNHPSEHSHYTNNTKAWKYLVGVVHLEHLWRKFKKVNPLIKVQRTTFRKHFKKNWKKTRKFKKTSLDGCEDCTRLEIWHKRALKANNATEAETIKNILFKHQTEADIRYRNYAADKTSAAVPLEPIPLPEESMEQTDPNSPVTEGQWEVDDILDDAYDGFGIHHWLVKWKPTGEKQWNNTWEPKENLEQCKEKLHNYKVKHGKVIVIKDLQKELETPLLRPVQATR